MMTMMMVVMVIATMACLDFNEVDEEKRHFVSEKMFLIPF